MRLKMFKVTVIMPVYNDEKYLVQAISSVLNQTLTGIELLCINDGSTDNSKNILDSFDEKYDSINVIHQSNSGAAACRNKAMKKASGDYITFLDSDDFYLDTDALEKMYNVAVENDDLIHLKSYPQKIMGFHTLLERIFTINSFYWKIISCSLNIQEVKIPYFWLRYWGMLIEYIVFQSS